LGNRIFFITMLVHGGARPGICQDVGVYPYRESAGTWASNTIAVEKWSLSRLLVTVRCLS